MTLIQSTGRLLASDDSFKVLTEMPSTSQASQVPAVLFEALVAACKLVKVSCGCLHLIDGALCIECKHRM